MVFEGCVAMPTAVTMVRALRGRTVRESYSVLTRRESLRRVCMTGSRSVLESDIG